MSAFKIMLDTYRDFLTQNPISDGTLEFLSKQFMAKSKYSEAFNQDVIDNFEKWLKQFYCESCQGKRACQYSEPECQLKQKFANDKLIWLGIKRKDKLASCCEVLNLAQIDHLTILGGYHCIYGAILPSCDFELVKHLNLHRVAMYIPRLTVTYTGSKTSIGFEHTVIAMNDFQTKKVNTITLNQINSEQSLLQLSGLKLCSLIWPINRNELEVLCGDYKTPISLSVIEDIQKNKGEPLFFDILVTLKEEGVQLAFYYQYVDVDGLRHSHKEVLLN